MSLKKASRTKAQRLRFWIQLAFFVLIACIATANALVEQGVEIPFGGEASLHAVCPFGGVVSFWNLVTLGTLVKKVHESSVVLAIIGILLALLMGPVICGWVCPFGTFQEWIGRLGKKLMGKRYNAIVPTKLDRVLRYLRYGMLIWVSYMTVISGKLFFQDIDPYYALFNFWRSEVSIAGFVVLGIVIVLSLFVERPFCKYACPYGAFQGIFNLFRVFSVRRRKETCISCNACTRACPMNIDVATAGTVRDHHCISCLKCTSDAACPVADTVVFSGPKDKGLLSTPLVGLLTVVLLFGGIGLSVLIGRWNTSSTKQPQLIRSGEFLGQPNPTDIRGSYTWQDIEKSFGVPVALVMEAFGASVAADRVSTLETLYAGTLPEELEVGTDSVRLFVSLYTGLPHEAEATTVLPASALQVLAREGKAFPAELEGLAAKVNLPAAAVQAEAASAVSEAHSTQESSAAEISFTGKTTFQELETAGFDMAAVEAITGKPLSRAVSIKTFVEERGLEFSAIKEQLQALK